MGSPDVSAEEPAERPERKVEVEPEEIELGTEDMSQSSGMKIAGKRSLIKPTGSAKSGLSV
jgi:hypothetical protein